MGDVFEPIALICMLAGLGLLARFLSPTTIFCVAIFTQVFSSTSDYLHLPIGPDRVLFAVAIGKLLLERRDIVTGIGRYRLHYLMLAFLVYVTCSAIWSYAFFDTQGFFTVLDQFGVMPFLLFMLAPQLFATEQQRKQLAITFLCLAGYLGITAIGEMSGNWWLVYPKFIADPGLGLHFGRARGPFLQSDPNGMVLICAALGSGVAAMIFRSRRVRMLCAGFAVLALLGAFLTLTRTIWIAAIVGPAVALLLDRRTRRFLVPAVACGALATVVALTTIPTLSDNAQERSEDQRPIWDRLNTNSAAFRMVEDNPLFGVGVSQFKAVSINYLQQAEDYPLTGTNLVAHNVYLARFAELGILGGSLWLAVLSLTFIGVLRTRTTGEMNHWKQASMGVFVAYLIIAMLTPATAALPNTLLWLLAGIVYRPRDETKPEPVVDVRYVTVEARTV